MTMTVAVAVVGVAGGMWRMGGASRRGWARGGAAPRLLPPRPRPGPACVCVCPCVVVVVMYVYEMG